MHLRGSRSLLGIIGIGCVGLSFAKDYLFISQAGFGLSQAIVFFYGLILFVAVYRTPKDQSLRSDWLRLIVIFGGGGGLALGLGLDHLIDGHWVYFRATQIGVIVLSGLLSLIGVFAHNRFVIIRACRLWLVLVVVFMAIEVLMVIEVSLPNLFVWWFGVGLSCFVVLFCVSTHGSAVRVFNFYVVLVFLILLVAELLANKSVQAWLHDSPVIASELTTSREWGGRTVRHSTKKYTDGTILQSVDTIDENGRRVCDNNLGSSEHKPSSIVFFGGSFTYGSLVANDETLPCQVALRKPGYGVHNYGAMGYGAHQFLAQLLANRVKPTLPNSPGAFVYSMLEGHAFRAVGGPSWVSEVYGPRFEVVDGALQRVGNLFRETAGGDSYNDLWTKTEALFYRSSIAQNHWVRRHVIGWIRKPEVLYHRIVTEISTHLKKHFPDSRLVVIYWDSGGLEGDWKIIPLINSLKKDPYTTLIRVSEILKPYDASRYALKHDGHPSAEAYSKVAEFLVREVL